MGELDSLRFLILEQGSIEGQIPPEIGDLQRLLILDMDFNQLTGTIPDEIYGLSSLQQLDLNDNQISGVISSSIENLRLLTFLQLDHNEFSSTIPSEMGTLQNLSKFDSRERALMPLLLLDDSCLTISIFLPHSIHRDRIPQRQRSDWRNARGGLREPKQHRPAWSPRRARHRLRWP